MSPENVPQKITPSPKTFVSSTQGDDMSTKEPPNVRKDFKDVLGGKKNNLAGGDAGTNQKTDVTIADSVTTSSMKKTNTPSHAPSIFDLSANLTADNTATTVDPSLAAGIGALPLQGMMQSLDVSTTSTQKFAPNPAFAQEMGDIAAITPNLVQQQPSINANANANAVVADSPNVFASTWKDTSTVSPGTMPQLSDTVDTSNYVAIAPITTFDINAPVISASPIVNAPAPIIDIYNQLVAAMTTMNANGQTDTTLTLKGAFAGVEVTISTFSTAPQELNISFTNLTQQMQSILGASQDALKISLNDIGFVTHMITLSTTNETSPGNAGFGQAFGESEDDTTDQGKGKRQ